MIPEDTFDIKVLGVATIPEVSSNVEVIGKVVPSGELGAHVA